MADTKRAESLPYHQLVERINRFPQGAPASELLERILRILFTEREAALVAQLPLRPFSAAKAARVWRVSESEARRQLEELAARAILVDLDHDGDTRYFLPPPMAGFFEFSLMRVRTDLDQDELSRLFFEYLNVRQEFIEELFARGETKLGRVFVNETVLPPELTAQVLDYERASEVIRSASHIAVGLCYCRNKMAHLERACEAPLDNCMTFNQVARSLIKNGSARQVEAAEGLALLQQARQLNLVQCGDNVQREVNFICHCCGCCCEALLALRRLAIPHRQYSTNYQAKIETARCNGCGNCLRYCPVEALTLEKGEVQAGKRGNARLLEELCLGCGVCVGNCPSRALVLVARPERIVTPVNAAHRVVLMAIERGTLQHLIFDNQAHFSHRAMATIFGAILRLGPVQRLLASQQLKSRFLERIFKDVDITDFSE
ncbi:(Fe-S)-binding protein [Geomonas limicola]|uniref:(Fe-S)-binding protein n=1 Tax=Geomonas limicola TaxID=2740186 RepID=A0A6V8N6D1_9BACT|nr:4Fe-4S dicluster domain-containing protein [Geomonas limicola]GFO67123.1 (Fe-S)-binding protein [Geomonas limicola]